MTESSNQSSANLPNDTSCSSVITNHSPSGKRDPARAPPLSSASSYTDLPYLFGVQDPAMLAPKPDNQAKSNNRRRKSAQDPQRVKHRRTRSGCYTCRNRRVKCDENRPVCERCRKGGRECVYPPPKEPSSKSKGSGSKAAKGDVNESAGSSSDEDEDEDADRLDSIPDEDEELDIDDRRASISTSGTHRTGTSQPSIAPRGITRHGSETPSLVQDKGNSPTPSTEGSIGYAAYQATIGSRSRTQKSSSVAGSDTMRSDWSHLPQDLQFYLEYFYENLTHHHYSLKYDPCNFLRSLFLDAALRNEALLYAVVGFSAFQATLHNPNGKIQDFLQYYNKAVSLLLGSLKRGERHNIGTLLAILQLATIEEYLGDWINLLGHQKAALEILMQLYNPQTVIQTDMGRVVLGWYMRFDVFAGLMGGFETVLPREWFSTADDFYQNQINREPNNLVWRIEKMISQLRLIAMDMSILFARIGRSEISQETFMQDNEMIGKRIAGWKENMDPALRDSRYLVRDFTGARPLDPDDIVDPYIPGTIYSGPLYVVNLSTLDWYAVDLMHKYQTALTMRTQPSAELGHKAYASCQLFEAIQFYPGSPNGIVLAIQASLGIACLFLPRDPTHAMWARRKLAAIESNGYIYPYTFRTKMADLFQDRSCMHWWLPNDEGYPSIVRSIRNFVEERTSPAKDVSTEDLRDMKAIFSSMKLDDGQSSLTLGKGKETGGNTRVAVASAQEQEWANQQMTSGSVAREGDTYGLGFDDGQGYWGQGQGGGAFGLPKQDNYQ